jgi:hypothetical protein
MQPVQFSCGHCGKLMAVGGGHLGQQVRCPHCQQVVFAPASAATDFGGGEAPPPPSIETTLHTPVPPADVEDIFGQSQAASDLFGRSEAPRIEMPSEPPPSAPPSDNVPLPPDSQAAATLSLPWAPADSASVPPSSAAVPASGGGTDVLPPGSAALWMNSSATETLLPPTANFPPPTHEETPAAAAPARRQSEAKAPWFLLLVFIPLLLYSIVITVFAVLLYRDYQHLQERHRNPFEMMPDVGDDPGVQKGKKVSRTDNYKPEFASRPLPDSQCIKLGESLRIGDLQVTANRVERRRVAVIVGKSRPELCQDDSLVLYLDLKNLSREYAFAPLDNYFDRYWRPGVDLTPPLTLLEVGGKHRFYGGPARWHPRGDRANPREWVEGRREQPDLLEPGQEKQMFVCTDGEDAKAAAVLFGEKRGGEEHSSFLWRVRVRRGLVRFEDKEYSATAVLGVRFTDKDIRQAAAEAQ